MIISEKIYLSTNKIQNQDIVHQLLLLLKNTKNARADVYCHDMTDYLEINIVQKNGKHF